MARPRKDLEKPDTKKLVVLRQLPVATCLLPVALFPLWEIPLILVVLQALVLAVCLEQVLGHPSVAVGMAGSAIGSAVGGGLGTAAQGLLVGGAKAAMGCYRGNCWQQLRVGVQSPGILVAL